MTSTRVRDWATVDYYALLGVDPSADADAITRAFREQAKRSHPDATDDADAASRFPDLAEAYAVLGDRVHAPRVRPGARRGPRRLRRSPRAVPTHTAASAPKPWSAPAVASR